MESRLAVILHGLQPIRESYREERGQSVALIALLMPVIVLFTLGLLDYAIATLRVQETAAVADLAAHAGAQEITLAPDGRVVPRVGAAEGKAAGYFVVQKPEHARLRGVACGLADGRPACAVVATTESPGYFLGRRTITVRAVGYLAYGAVRRDQ